VYEGKTAKSCIFFLDEKKKKKEKEKRTFSRFASIWR
jgi:hypothetical protein